MAAIADSEKAQDRANILWQHHREHGRLLIADIKCLVDVQCSDLYRSFRFNNIKAPPIWDSHAEKIRRKAQVLTDEARRLAQPNLTREQAGRLLGIKPSRVSDVITQIVKRGYSIPEIIKPDDFEDDSFPRMNGNINSYYHPIGLQVLRYWPGPGINETTYLLR